MYYSRKLEKELHTFLADRSAHKNVLILAGARQVGKSTLIKHVVAEKPHLLLHLEQHPSIAEHIDACESFQDFSDYLHDEHHFQPEQKILIIDEAQQSQKLGSFVRFMKEEWQHANVILTGSLIGELHADEHREPVGRESYLELWPLTFTEFLQALAQDSLVRTVREFQLGSTISVSKHERLLAQYEQYLQVGGLPEVVRAHQAGKDYRKIRADIFASYANDFVRYFSLEDINLFKRALEAVAANVGSPSKDTHVVRLDAPGYKKVASIFARLEKWRIIIKCEQLGLVPEKNKFSPKRYLYDVGVLSDLRLRTLPAPSLQQLNSHVLQTALGGMIENAVAHSLRVQWGSELFGIKHSSNAEIDFGVRVKNEMVPIECKLSKQFKQNFMSSLQHFLEKSGGTGKAILLYGGLPETHAKSESHALPFYMADELKRLCGE